MPYTTLKTLNKSFQTDSDRWEGHSRYFDVLFSGRWGDKQDDNSYFIEADSDVFEHILRYLRTGVLPIFYDNTNGHDYAKYHSLLGEAQYFGIDRLCRWIQERKYLDAVRIRHSADKPQPNINIRADTQEDVTVHPITLSKPRFFCQLGVHKFPAGSSLSCACGSGPLWKAPQEYAQAHMLGRLWTPDSPLNPQSSQAHTSRGGWKNEDSLHWGVVRKQVVFDHDLCVTAFLGK
jgi:hypothetical protein